MRAKRPPDEGRMLQLVYYAYVVLSRVALALPEPLVYALAHVAGAVSARVSKKRRVVARNLALITGSPPDSPEVRTLVVEAFKSYARYWLETFRLVREGREFFLDRVRVTGTENLDALLTQGRGAIVVVGHLGNWDAVGAWVGARGNRLVTVAEVLKPRRMFDFFVAHRARLGMTIYPAERGTIVKLAKAVEEGAVVAIVGDRDLHQRGPEVTFFGERVRMPAGPASLALKLRVPLLVAGVYGVRLEDGRRGWSADITDPLPLPEPGDGAIGRLTQEVARTLEEMIARRPEEWHMFQPIFPARPGPS